MALIFPVFIILMCFSKYRKMLKLFFRQLVIFMLMFGIGIVYINIENNIYDELYKIKEINENAIVISSPQETRYRVKYTVKIVGNTKLNNKKYILQLKKNAEKLEYGTLIKIRGRYNPPTTSRNFGGFDYANYLKTKKIYGIIEGSKVDVLEQEKLGFVLKGINNFRNIIINNSKEIMKNSNASGILIGLLIGDTQNIDENTVNDFKNSSLAHLLAVSGQHVSYIIITVSFILKLSKMGKRGSYFWSIVIIILFVLLTGASATVLRAGIMGIIILLAKLFYRKSDIYTSIAVSAIIIFLNNPFAIYDIGLWLSYRWYIRHYII